MAKASSTHILLYIVNSDKRPVAGASVQVRGIDKARELDLSREGTAELALEPGESVTFDASAPGFAEESLTARVVGRAQQVVIGLRREGELSYDQGDSRFSFKPDRESYLLFVQGEDARPRLERLLDAGARLVSVVTDPRSDAEAAVPADLAVVRATMDAGQMEALVARAPQDGLQVQVTRPIDHEDHVPAGLTNELVVRFQSDVEPAAVAEIAARLGFEVAREIRHAGNAYLFVRRGVPDYDLLDAARALGEMRETVYVEPNLAFVPVSDQYTPNDFLWANLPHLPLIDCDDAWDLLDNVAVDLRGGSAAITVGVVDLDGVAPDHPDFTALLTDGNVKLVASWNFAAAPIAVQTVVGLSGNHGTQCAGSATGAFDDDRGICGVAPNCGLLGARIGSSTAVAMADLYMWMGGFMNGSTAAGFPAAPPARPADVISSSWGANGLPLSNTIRDLFDFLTAFGRGGRGCVLCFSPGNSGYIDFTVAGGAHRAWPTYEKTIAVGASISTNPTNPTSSFHADPTGATAGIATQVDTRALYSPYGTAALLKPDLVSPSHTTYAPGTGTVIDPIMSAVRVGTGAVDGCDTGTCFDYAQTFGGTSHACPTVAGAIALILSARPALSWIEVRDTLRRTCAKIDPANANAIGQWQDLDADAAIDYSRWYGFGRLDVDAAVQRALDSTTAYADCYVRENQTDVGNVPSPGWHAHSPDIWVRQTDDPIPALAWTSDPPHQNAERGQDNYVYCRTRNRGPVAATTIYLRASITHYPGFEFRYPQEFQPTTPVGTTLPSPMTLGTYLIGETQIDNLAPGADQIVKMTWPEALIPPATVTVGTTTVNWHPCLLLEVSPHDGAAIDTTVIAVRGSNNLAQRNIAIDDLVPDSGADGSWFGMVAGSHDLRGIRTLLIDGSRLKGTRRVRLSLLDPRLMRHFVETAMRDAEPGPGDSTDAPIAWPPSVPIPARTMRDPHGEGCCGLLMRIGLGGIVGPICPRPRISVSGSGDDAHVVIDGLTGSAELRLALPAGQFTLLRASIGAGTSGELRLTQRRGDGQVSAGYSIVR